MKRLHIILLLGMLSLVSGLQAQEDAGEQLLVFRNTGVVDLLYTNEVDSILTNDTTQVFYAKDTVLVVPLAELDSVAVGSRNEMKFHEGVKELVTEEDLPWITRFDGNHIFYRLDTPQNMLPKKGMKLFYGLHAKGAGIFPYGLCAKVTAVDKLGDEMKVDIELLQLDDIFSSLFLAGPVHAEVDVPLSRMQRVRKAPANDDIDLGFSLDVGDMGSVEVNGKLNISGNVVVQLGYRHADLDITYGYGIGVKLQAKESATHHFEELGPEARIGTFYGLLNIEAAAGAFADLAAELSFGMDIERTYQKKLLWTRQDDENSFEFRNLNEDEPFEDKAQFDLTLDGSLYFGPMVRLDFVTIGDLIGARAKLKIGPEVEGQISLGMLQNMRNYQSQFYGSAELSVCSKVAVEGFTTNRHYLVWGDVDEHNIFNVAIPFGVHSINLFPDYMQSSAVASTTESQEEKVDVAAAIETPTPTDLETGFEIVDPQGEIVDSVFVGTIKAEPEETVAVQTFDTAITLPAAIKHADLEGYTMRPVFHYAGYTISAAPVGIKKDVLLQPYTATQSNGAMTFISSGPFQGSAVSNDTFYQVGAYLPVPLKNNVYKK